MQSFCRRLLTVVLGVTPIVAVSAHADSPFTGLWQGSWTDASTAQHGGVVLGVAAGGRVSGAVSNDAVHQVGPLAGVVLDNGKVVLAYSYDGKTRLDASGVLRVAGGQLQGEVDFMLADGRRIGHGILAMQPVSGQIAAVGAAAPPKPTRPAPATPVVSPAPAAPSTTEAGPIPTGQWKCFSASNWTFTAGGIGSGTFTAGQFGGYMWIYDAHHYANMTEKPEDRGTYDLVGNELHPHDGPWVRAHAVLHYMVHGLYGKPTIHLGWSDAPGVGLACTQ